MIIQDIAERISRGIEAAQDGVNEALFEPVIRLGVTGLSRAGKTVFITSLVANLLDRGRLPGLRAVAEGRLINAHLRPQPDDDVARFPIESHLGCLKGNPPQWPQSTNSISQLRLSLRVQPSGILGSFSGSRTVHLDIVDYPGEWLLDLPLMEQDYARWSQATLEQAATAPRSAYAKEWLDLTESHDGSQKLDEAAATSLAAAFTGYLRACRADGLSACAPGRFLMPGDLAGSPALTFAPMPKPERVRGGSLWRAMERRFESYKRIVVKPFFRNHFARVDRQIVLVDMLGAIHDGPTAVEDLRIALTDILNAFRPGRNSWLSSLLGKRVERILFAATKADHLHHEQHGALEAVTAALLAEARNHAAHKGANVASMALASWRSTVEDTIRHDGTDLNAVRGTLEKTGQVAAMYPGTLPSDPAHLLSPAANGAEKWLDHDFDVMRFAPPRLTLAPGDGPPHIRLDKALEYLIGDRLP